MVEGRSVLGVSWQLFVLVVVVEYGSSLEWFGGWWMAERVRLNHGFVCHVLVGLGGSRC